MNKKQNKTRQDKQKTKTFQKPVDPVLRISPTAWAKLVFFRDRTDNEIGGFGISRPDDLLFVEDFQTVKQKVTSVSIEFDDSAIADFFDTQVDLGRKPEQFARVWAHTHPADSAHPSSTDEETFQRVFGDCQWAVIFVLAEGRNTYARLRFNIGPGGHVLVPVRVDYSGEFASSDYQAWEKEYCGNIEVEQSCIYSGSRQDGDIGDFTDDLSLPQQVIEQLEEMEPAERQFVLDELSGRPDLLDDESEVMF